MDINALVSVLPPRHWREINRLFNNHQWEQNDEGDILIGSLRIGGVFESEAPDGLGVVATHNIVPTEGLNYYINAGIYGGTRYTQFYVAPFSGNVAVTLALTAANFAATQTEITAGYSEATRPEFVGSAPVNGVSDNSANPAVITAAVDNLIIWGLGVLSVPAKGATTGVLVAANKYPAARTLVTTGDDLGIKYKLTIVNQT